MRHQDSLTNTFIGQDSWSLPWFHAVGQDWKNGELREGPSGRWHTNYSDYLGSLVLYPAAGEMISIHLDTYDSFLNQLSSSMSVRVSLSSWCMPSCLM